MSVSGSGFWSPEASELHSDPEQRKRQASGSKIEIDLNFLDREYQTIVIKDYVVTLAACTCRDFALRRLPCKHMYRLADELGVYEIGTNRYGNRYPEHDNVWVAEVAALSRESQALYHMILATTHTGQVYQHIFFSHDPRIQELLGAGLLEVEASGRSIGPLRWNDWRELVAILDGLGVRYRRVSKPGRQADMYIDGCERPDFRFARMKIPDTIGCYDRFMRAYLNKSLGE